MATAPILETPRLRLFPFGDKHLTARYVGWLNDPEVVRFSEQRHRRHTLGSCRAYLRAMVRSPNLFWAIEARDPDLGHIGNVTAYVDPPNELADVAIMIGERRCWGRGYGSEAWTAVCDHLLSGGGMRKITAGTLAPNKGMLAVMRKSGLVEDGRRRRHYLVDGKEVDMIYAARFRDKSKNV